MIALPRVRRVSPRTVVTGLALATVAAIVACDNAERAPANMIHEEPPVAVELHEIGAYRFFGDDRHA